MERIAVHIYGLVIGFHVNLPLLCYNVVQNNFDHLDIPYNTLVHFLNEVILIGLVSW